MTSKPTHISLHATRQPQNPWRRDLGTTFAARKIEVASLVIRSTTQQPLFADNRIGTTRTHINRPADAFDHLLDTTRSVLQQVKKSERKTVHFSDRNQVYEIERYDYIEPETPVDEPDELFSAGNDYHSDTSAESESESESENDGDGVGDGVGEKVPCEASENPTFTSSHTPHRAPKPIKDDLLIELARLNQSRRTPKPTESIEPDYPANGSLDLIQQQIIDAIHRAKRFNLQPQIMATEPDTKPDYHNDSRSLSRVLTERPFSDPDTTVIYNRRPPNARSMSTSSSIASSLLIIDETPEDNEDISSLSIHSSEHSLEDLLGPQTSETSWEEPKPHGTLAKQNHDDESLGNPVDCVTAMGTSNSDPVQDLPSRASTPLTYSGSVSTDRTRTYSQDILPFYEESVSSMNLKLFPVGLYSKRSMESISSIDLSTYKGRLYIKIDAAKDLDFPIVKDSPNIRCVLHNGSREQTTDYCPMRHTIPFQQEFYIDVDATSEFTLVLQAQEPVTAPPASRYDQPLRRLWDQAINTRTDALQRYIRPMDRAIAQTRISVKNIVSEASSNTCSASLALVNGWYRSAGNSLLGNKLKKRSSLIGQEKAVGKMEVQFFFLPESETETDCMPSTMSECEQGFSTQRFHLTCWKTGSMTQLGGDAKSWQRRFYRLEGGNLIACDESLQTIAVIDLSKVILLAVNHKIIIHANEPQHKRSSCYTFGNYTKSSASLLPQLLQTAIEQSKKTVEYENADADADCDSDDNTDKSSFQCVFGNGDKIEFSCDSQSDCERWLDVLKVIIGRVPAWPKWLKNDPHIPIPS